MSIPKRLFGIVGSIMLILSVFFTPAFRIPISGNLGNYLNDKCFSVAIIVLAIISLVLVFWNKRGLLMATGLTSLIVCLCVILFCSYSMVMPALRQAFSTSAYKQSISQVLVYTTLAWMFLSVFGSIAVIIATAKKKND
jgi:hypothetical protein